MFSVISWLSVFQSSSVITAIPLMQMHVPNMISPRNVRSTGTQESVHAAFFTDASPVFKFLSSSGSESHGINFGEQELASVNVDEMMIRYAYLNNYLGYNMLII